MELDPNQQAAQDRRMLIAMGLTAIVVFFFYSFVFDPPSPPPPPGDEVATESATESTTPTSTEAGTPAEVGAPLPAVDAAPAASSAPARTVDAGWTGVGATWSSLGGGPATYVLDDYVAQPAAAPWLPTWLWETVKGEKPEPFTLACADPTISGHVDLFRAKDVVHLPVGTDGRGVAADVGHYEVVSRSTEQVVFATRRDDIEITKSYRLPKEGFITGYTVTFRNVGGSPRELTPSFGVADHMPEAESRYGPEVEAHAQIEGDHETASEETVRKKNGELTYAGPMSWWGIGDKYFMVGLEPAEPIAGTAEFAVVDAEAGLFSSSVTVASKMLAPGESASYDFKLWAGPKTLEGLETAGMRMASSVDFGVFGLIAIPILYFLKFLYGLVNSYGIAIIVLTMAVKLLLFPLTQKQYRSMQAMQELNPEIQAMKERLADDREAQNKEMMKLFQERGVNPMGGCLPMVVQMPIWFALYRVLWMSADMYQAEFLYFCDLTLQDPLGVLPVLMSLTMYITQRMNQSPTMDPAQQKIMSYMSLFFGVIMFTLPAGLVLYIFVNNILSILQQWVIKKGIGDSSKPAGSKA